MKQKKKSREVKIREEKIIEFVKKNPSCSQAKIFKNGKIEKSKVTIKIFNKLISQNKIKITYTKKGFSRYYVEEEDFLTGLKRMIKFVEYECKKDPKYDNKFSRKFIEYVNTRIKVLEAERKIKKNLNLDDTFGMWFNYILPFLRNPTKLHEIIILDLLNWSIKDDKYYLKHQLHYKDKPRKHKFYKSKILSVRRSITDLLDMKNNGRQEFGISRSAYRKHMEKLTDEPNRWFDRFFSEKNRTLYNNSPELQMEIQKEILKNIKLDRKDPDYKIKKKLLDAEKKSFPYPPIATVLEIIPEKDMNLIRKTFEESGYDFDMLIELAKNENTIWNPVV